MDFDNRKVYGDTSITDGFVCHCFLWMIFYDVLFVCLSLLPLDDPPGAACSAQRLRARKLSWGGETNVIAQILILINFLPGAAQPEAV